MQLSKALFCFAVLCITVTLADFRHIPERSKMFCEENHTSLAPFLRHLDSSENNSQDKSSSSKKTEPVTVRLQGSTEMGYYYVTLFLGTPVQKQTFIVDTGSVTTTVPCVECGNDCGTKHFDKPFNNDDSKSFETFKCNEGFGEYTCYDCNQHCPFSVSYVEGSSYKGHFNKDFISFGNEIEDSYLLLKQNAKNLTPQAQENRNSIEEIIEERKVFMPFGCTNKETKLFYDQEADGILGLGVNTNTRSSPPNILDALKIHNPSFSKAFSLCLAENGGYFTLGGYNAAYHLPNQKTQYTEYSDAFGQYKVFISKIEMEGESIGLKPTALNSGEGAFFDSGTTLTHAPKATYDAVRSHMKSYCRDDDERCGKQSETTSFCYKYNPNDFSSLAEFYKTFPTFTFIFGRDQKSSYEWKGEDYLYIKEETEDEYCLGLAHYERETILGGTFMKNHDILFDKEKKRIGFARANCGAVQGVAKPAYFEKKEIIEQGGSTNNGEVLVTNTENDNENDSAFWKAVIAFDKAIKAAIVFLLVSAVVVVLVCLLRRVKNKRKYQQMKNVEIQSAGINGRPLNVSDAQTPQLKANQPAQEEKSEVDSSQDDETNPEIRVD